MKLYIQLNTTLSTGGAYSHDGIFRKILAVTHRKNITILALSDSEADSAELAIELDKKNALENLTVEVNGKTFSVDDASQNRMSIALTMSSELGIRETKWKLAKPFNGSKIAVVTADELKAALFSGIQKVGELVISEEAL